MSTTYVTAYYIDARFGHPASEAPLRNGPMPPSENLIIDAVDRRQSPPLIIGRVPDGEPMAPGMTKISESAHTELLGDYQAWRKGLERRRRAAMVVSRFQARAVLREMGLREQVEAIMADPETPPLVVDAWTDAQEFRRLSPTIQALAAKLDLTDEQVDEMFEQASQIEA